MRDGILPDRPGGGQDPVSAMLHARLVRRATGYRPALVVGVSPDPLLRDLAMGQVLQALAAGRRSVIVVELDALALAGSAAGAPGLDARLRDIAANASADVRTVVVLDGFEAVDFAGRSGAALAAAIARGGVAFIAVAAPQVAALVQDDPRLGPLVAVVRLSDVAADADLASPIGRHHGVTISPDAVAAAAALVRRHVPGAPLVAEVAEILDEAAAAAAGAQQTSVAPEVVRAVVAERTGIPVPRLQADDLAHLQDLEARLHERIVGQDTAVAAVAAAVRRRSAGVGDPDRPLGSFLFVGPTGVGKTELARALASTLFADDAALIRLDMGEYQEPQSVARLVGAPPGYVGYGYGGHLSEPLRTNPASVVLLDEIEKAHNDVLATLLAVLEDGRLTDGTGRVVDARHAVIIMTSNLGTAAALELSGAAAAHAVLAAVADRLAPEFRNRIDETVVFTPLGPAQLQAIVRLQVGRLQSRLAGRGIHLEVTADACEWLARCGTDTAYGARPIRREIRRQVEDALADEIVAGRLRAGAGVIIDRGDDRLVVNVGA